MTTLEEKDPEQAVPVVEFDTKSTRSSRALSVDGESVTTYSKSHYGSMSDSDEPGPSAPPPIVLAEKEQRAVLFFKVLVIVVLGLSLIALATATYLLIRNEEQDDFEAQFNSYASEIIAVSKRNLANSMRALDGFTVMLTSYAKSTNQTWPFVTVRDYEARATKTVEMVGAFFMILGPYVTGEQRLEFEEYALYNKEWACQQTLDYVAPGEDYNISEIYPMDVISVRPNISNTEQFPQTGPGPHIVNYQLAPTAPGRNTIFRMSDMYEDTQGTVPNAFETMKITKTPTINFGIYGLSQILFPIFEDVPNPNIPGSLDESKVVAILRTTVKWENYLKNLVPPNVNGIVVVFESSCNKTVSYEIDGLNAAPLGNEDMSDPNYAHLAVEEEFLTIPYSEDVVLPPHLCVPQIKIRVVPSQELEETFMTNRPYYYAAIVASVVLFTALIFALYDQTVRRRQRIFMQRVIRQDRIVSNVFPAAIRDRLYNVQPQSKLHGDGSSTMTDLDLDDPFGLLSTPPIADLFLSSTVLFADISGFTAWSSAREPPQVFALLESVYSSFDKAANSLGVFKVETVGDCYVACCGCPEENENHALVMARFARECNVKMKQMTRKLEVRLGPDTGDLKLRIGLHSGQVTAGVLRGERSRYQIFGDTVNTTSRIESTGMGGKIHVSNITAELLRTKHNKEQWLIRRSELTPIKGKGDLQTFWLETKSDTAKREKYGHKDRKSAAPLEESGHQMLSIQEENDVAREDESETFVDPDEEDDAGLSSKKERLVGWLVEVMVKLLQQVVAARNSSQTSKSRKPSRNFEEKIGQGATVLEEFKEIIHLPKVSNEDIFRRQDPDSIELGEAVISQLRDYIACIADMYNPNSFHNFEHAVHVTSSVRKMLTRIVKRTGVSQENAPGLVDMAGHSYGITSDPMTQLAVILSAVMHDADHPGVGNVQLVKENTPNAIRYKKSIAEQNSVDQCWELLMRPDYKDLRACIYTTEDELLRFRQLVVNTVMATDIVDKELGALRKGRWEKAFTKELFDVDCVDRKATIVIEHLIQASDVSHTMQHWQIYKRWNERFFEEVYGAWKAGRGGDTDPSLGWYKGEIGFFDFYVIPLAKKLESCGVFGVSSHEYLQYAQQNREEWVRKGEDIVKEYLVKYGSSADSNDARVDMSC
ncbi:Receptor-type guanylate cyclase gcy [Seminavis robusta]|uniref:Receptor-type guanylate cyclase gcy n=1 Tax=Seminavis robusta TaxID=568900 RepID=A0A9N8DHN8_9STRA|nr:Receptor-type guanylate cyclase gcy [Seminavis robusta]|eukprot:Sro126_g060580.1 Receptor-type guanylate cyclase gcy (1162) ;mRNA; f:58423-62824